MMTRFNCAVLCVGIWIQAYMSSTLAEESSKPSGSIIRKCGFSDTKNLNKCLKTVFEELKPRIGEGIPELNLPGLDPLKLDHFEFNHGDGPVKIVSSFQNVVVTGLKDYTDIDFWVDIPTRRLDFNLTFPQAELIGLYKLSGNLFFLPISGQGNFWEKLGNITAQGSGKLDIVNVTSESGSYKRVLLRKTVLDLDIDSFQVKLTNLFNGDPLLGTVINRFLNENGKEIFEELRPQISIQVAELLTTFVNGALKALSPDYFSSLSSS